MLTDSSKFAQRWAAGMSSAQQKIVDGINATTVEPNKLAAQAANKYLMATADAVNSGRYAAANNAVPAGYWKAQFIAKVSRVGAGAQTAQPRMQAFGAKLLPQLSSISAAARAMPSDTYEQRKARSTYVMDQLHALKGSFH